MGWSWLWNSCSREGLDVLVSDVGMASEEP